MIFLKYLFLPFLFGMACYTYSRWIVSKKIEKINILLSASLYIETKINRLMDAKNWESYSQLVLTSLVEIKDEQKNMNKEITKIKIDIGMLKVKSGMYGFLGSALALGLAILVGYLKN